jgi:uncharacterized protein YabE (DUF348 family)/3D (Asp-Asp-Asp) domain-containing protein
VTLAQAIRVSRHSVRPKAEGQHITRSDLLLHPRHFRGRHHAATILAIVLVAVVAFRLFPTREVTVLNDGEAVQVSATFNPQSEGLAAASVDLAKGDRVLFADGGRHSSVAVQRARDVRIELDGKAVTVRTQATTVNGALAAAGVSLRPGDLVYFEGQLTSPRGPLMAPAFVSANPASAVQPARASDASVHLSVRRARPVTVYVDTIRTDLATAATTVEGLLADLGMTVREGDLVRPGLAAPVSAGMTVRLGKARTITLKIDGKEQALYTTVSTVGDILRLLNLDPAPDELLDPPRETFVTNGMTLVIGLNRIVEESETTPISPGVAYEVDTSLPAGTVRIVPGLAGSRLTTYRVSYKNGQVISKTQIGSSSVTQAPIPARNITGPRPAGAASRPILSAPDYNGPYIRKLIVDATWYNASHGGKAVGDPWYGRTATGAHLEQGICAVDPSVIPLGTLMYIPKYGKCEAADVGGAIVGAHVDLGFPESVGDPGWGFQTVEIYILPPP